MRSFHPHSSLSFKETIDLLKASDATVYVIGELEHQLPSAKTNQRLILQRIAEVTGGQAFFPTSVKDLDAVYEKVLAEIRAQYTIGFVSSNERTDGAWRKLEIKAVKRDGRDLKARARRGYFAPSKKE